VYRLARYREWQVGLVMMGMVAGYLPWLMYLNRTVFQFYTITFEPYLLLGVTCVIGLILGLFPGSGARAYDPTRQGNGTHLVVVFLIFAVLITAFFYPLWTGMQTSFAFWQLHTWMPSWR